MIDITVTTFDDKLVIDIEDYDYEEGNIIHHSSMSNSYSNSIDGWVKLISDYAKVCKMYRNASHVMRYGKTGDRIC